jgi:CBS domain-containing protein
MDVELIEIREFIAGHPPFDQLPTEVLDTLPRRLAIRYLRRGSPFPADTDAESGLCLVRTGAIEFRDDNGALLDKLGEGDIHAALCLEEADKLPLGQGIVAEDSLLYFLPCETFRTLRKRYAAFNSHFEHDLRQRLQHAISELQQSRGATTNLMGLECAAVITRDPVTVAPTATIRQAAQRMSEERVSCLLVSEADRLIGIVTDRDLRQRCLAEGVDSTEPVSRIMTASPFSITGRTPATEALLQMTRRHIHHLPVVSDEGRMEGVITANDLLHQHSLNTVALAAAIHRSDSIEALVEASARLPELQLQFIHSGMTASHLTQALSSVIDAITIRLLALAEEKLGQPPVPYIWLVCGSQARREQTSVSDQDNALLIADTLEPEDDVYFSALATFVSDGLARCGFVYCPGKVMATNPTWRQPLKQWHRYFNDWINSPEPMALMHTSIFFDMRPLYGDDGLYQTLREEVLKQCRDNRIFLAYMTANALKHRPPLGFFRQFVLVHDDEHDDSLDLKHRGVIPVVDLARVFALSAGLTQLNTQERLIAAEKAGVLSHEGAEDLLHAVEFIATLRARHQAEQHQAGVEMDNFIRPDNLSRMERIQLKDAFAAIATMQEALAQRYQSARFA